MPLPEIPNETIIPMIDGLNALNEVEARQEFSRCCGATQWVEAMLTRRPFLDAAALYTTAEEIWFRLAQEDWQEAFRHHPRLGDMDALRQKFAQMSDWSAQEQSGIQGVSEDILQALAQDNAAYEEKFGFIFILCATGKSAVEMLSALHERMKHSVEEELRIAAIEHHKITRLRLEKLLVSLAPPQKQKERSHAQSHHNPRT